MVAEDSAYRSFAQNLYALSVSSGSIASTCRQLGINRQQFNKYLAGTTLPSSSTLLKISKHFGVDQRSLFEDPHASNENGYLVASSVQTKTQFTALEARVLAEMEGTQCTSLREGCYYVYFPGKTGSLIFKRSALFVRNVDGRTIFVRLSTGQNQTTKLRKAQMRHEGLALETDNRVYLLAKNKHAHQEISLLSFGNVDLSSKVFGGLALTLAPWGAPVCTRFSVEYVGPWSDRREVVRNIGPFSVVSPDVSDDLRLSLTTPLKSTEPVLDPYDFFEQLRGRRL